MKKLIIIIMLLACGVGFYWLFRPNIYLFEIIGIENNQPIEASSSIFIFFRIFLPDLLWAIAINLTAILMASKKFPVFYIYSLIILPFLSEIFQYTGLMPGTFDWYDLVIYLFVFLLCFNKKIIHLCKKNLNNLSVP